MILSKSIVAGSAAVLLALVAGATWQWRSNARLRADLVGASGARAAALAELERQVAAATRRAAAAEARVAAMLKDVESGRATRAAALVAGPTDMSEYAKSVIARAQALIKEGKPAEALQEYVNAYRELAAKRPGSSECQSLMSAMRALGRNHPPALTALAGLRDEAMTKYAAKPDREVAFEIALLNERLGEGRRTVAFYDTVADASTRQSLAFVGYAAFVEARRYEDALLGKRVGQMLTPVEAAARIIAQNPAQEAGIRRSVIEQTLTSIEVLTGAGKKEDARLLTEKLLAFDNSDATREALRQHVARAGGG